MPRLLYIFALLAFFFASAAQAQFADQRQYASTSTGSANAQAVAVPNYTLNPGVAIRFRPSFTNTSAMTLNVNGQGAVYVEKQTVAGLTPLIGGEIVSGQMAEVFFDGAQFELLNSATAVSVWGGVSAGSANVQTVTAATPFAGQQITFAAGYTNTGVLTLNGVAVDKDTATGPVAMTGGEVYAGNVVSVAYDSTLTVYHFLNPSSGSLAAVTLASAATTDLGSTHTPNVTVSGTTAITSFGSSASLYAPIYRVLFSGALTLTNNNTSLILPGAANITTAAGDSLVAQYLGSGDWQVLSYSVALLPPSPRVPIVNVYTSGTAQTYTTTAGAISLEIDMVGGGSGGTGSVTSSASSAGGATTFGSLTANGGPAAPAPASSAAAPAAATATGCLINQSGGLGDAQQQGNQSTGYGHGGFGASSFFGGGGPGASVGAGMPANGVNATGYGAGGGGGGDNSVGSGIITGWGGNSGAHCWSLITSPAATYTYTVGAGSSGTAGYGNGGNGTGGLIRVIARFQ